MSVHSYIENISKRYALGNATEHTFRGDLQQLIELLVPDVAATNEPKRIECGAPDYVITRKDIPVGYIEAKDIGVDLASNTLKEQLDRYRKALDNLIFTDYLDFRLYLNGELVRSVRIAEIQNGRIVPLPENFDQFTSLIKEFCVRTGQTIKSSKKLAEMMADKAKMLAYIIKNALEGDEESQANSTLKEQMSAFKQILIHDIDAKSFADIYAQTIAYGMFAARLHDPNLETFSRQEAAELIPKTNPFLRKLFQYVAGYDLDERIKWIVDALAEIFRAADVAAILKNFGRSTQTHDPIMHFYETFLAEYDPKLRKSRGVFYTPEPVVDFIVRAVDDILKTEFGLPQGLADTSKIKVTVDQQGKKVEKEFHKVQILDPATGTGTFLAQVIKQIHKGFDGQQGIWSNYVENHLIPRLNGFELLMASYAMAHLKLDLLLTETGYRSPGGSQKSSPPVLGGVDAALGGRGGPLPVLDYVKINNLPQLSTFRTTLRKKLTPAEAYFWKIVKNSKLDGRKFRRQHSVGRYILDFFCPSEELAIELDGQHHFGDEARDYDRERRLFLERYGIKVIRFENKRVFEDLDWVLDVIRSNFGWNKSTTPSAEAAATPPKTGGELSESASGSPPIKGGVSGLPGRGGSSFASEGRGGSQRFQIYLTNSLEEYHPDTGTLWASWLSTEANEANHIKRDTPVMVVIGNPPYSVSSSNKSKWIEELMVDYKKDLDERNINPLSDDYLKFIRFGEYFIDKNGEGILAYITNNSFVSGVIHRQVRKQLLQTFGAIYILNLHGNSAQQERSPDGSVDENVFDIKQGVSISIFVKSALSTKVSAKKINYRDLFGTRKVKYGLLHESTLDSLAWNEFVPQSPDFFFIPLDHAVGDNYKKGFSTGEIFPVGASGIKTERDSLVIRLSESELMEMKNDLVASDVEEFRIRHREKPDGRDWKIGLARKDLVESAPKAATKIQYRPFDVRFTFYTGRIKGVHAYPRGATMKHMLSGENHALLVGRQNKSGTVDSVFVTKLISEMKSSERTIQSYHFPLYLYPEDNAQQTLDGRAERVPNLNSEIVERLAAAIGLTFVSEPPALAGGQNVASSKPNWPPAHAGGSDSPAAVVFAPIDILDYIYAVLHSPTYREKYKEFLKIDFPRVPYPTDAATFWQLVALGGELRQIHLLESRVVGHFITGYPVDGDNVVGKPEFKNPVAAAPGSDTGNVYINDTQYFSNVPEIAWNFYIGGYQPAQKWLKDRRGRNLDFEDIRHYQKIIVALTETDRIMKEIDRIDFIAIELC